MRYQIYILSIFFLCCCQQEMELVEPESPGGYVSDSHYLTVSLWTYNCQFLQTKLVVTITGGVGVKREFSDQIGCDFASVTSAIASGEVASINIVPTHGNGHILGSDLFEITVTTGDPLSGNKTKYDSISMSDLPMRLWQ